MYRSRLSQESTLTLPQRMVSDITVPLFWLFALGHLVIWMCVCLATQPNMPLDMVEMLYWGNEWQLGYHKHPPLPAWTAASAWWLSGGSPWTIYFASQLTILATFWAAWQLGREYLRPNLALVAVILLEGCYYYNYTTADINNTIVTRPMWALAVLFMYRSITRNETRDWVLTGIVFGLGMLSKYYMGVIILCLMLVPVVIPETRRLLKTRGPWLTTAVALAIFLPHAIWMVNNDFITLTYVLNRSDTSQASIFDHVVNPVVFIATQLGAIVPIVLLARPLMGSFHRRPTLPDEFVKRRYLELVVLGPILFYLTVSFILGSHIRSMWGGPLFTFAAIYLFHRFETKSSPANVDRVVKATLAVGVLMATAAASRNVLGPHFQDKASRIHFPGQTLSAEISRRWQTEFDGPIPVVGGNYFIAGNVGVYASQPASVYSDIAPETSPWTSDADMQQRGGVLIWNAKKLGDELPEEFASRFSQAELQEPVVTPYQTNAGIEPARFGVAFVPPKANVTRMAGGSAKTH